MHYEINVAKNGKHYFATHERSISTEEKAKELYKKLTQAFPESEGYTVSVTKWESLGKPVKF